MATTKKTAVEKPAREPVAVENKPAPIVNPVKPGDVKLNDMMHQNWACFAPSHYTQEMVENPKVWTFMAVKFKDLDSIRVTAEDGSWVAFGIVRRSISMEVNVQIYDWVELQESQIAEEIRINNYVIRHFGSVRRFAVVNTVNGTVVKEGFQTQSDALKYATSQIQATATLAKQA
jgi:hypothetical protein